GGHAENHLPSNDRKRRRRMYEVGFRFFPSPASWNRRMRHAASVRPEKNKRRICSDDKYRAVAIAASSSRSRLVTRTPPLDASDRSLAFSFTVSSLFILELNLDLSKSKVNWPPRPSPMTTLVAQFPGAISDPFLHRRWEGGVRNRDALEARHGTSHPSGARAQSKG